MGRVVTPAIVRNATLAYVIRASLFVPLFALGAAGDVWPAIAAALGLAVGFRLAGALRRRTKTPDDTLPGFLAEACSGDVMVRRAVAVVTIVGLLGLVGAEAVALAVVLGPLLGEGFGNILFVASIVAAGLIGLSLEPSRLFHVAQALLGAVFIGLFGAVAFLVYLVASDLRALPPHGALALLLLVGACIALLVYRQSKYVETPLLASPDTRGWRRTLARHVRALQRFANVAVSVFAVLAVVLAGMVIYTLGPTGIAWDALAALGSAPAMPLIGCVAIALLAAAYPLVDAAIWRNAGALADAGGRDMRVVAGESALFVIVIASFGAIAILATDLPPESTGIADFIRQLSVFDHPITDAALTLLLVGLAAMATATASVAVSAALTLARTDILAGAAGKAPALTAAIAIATAATWFAAGIPVSGAIDARFFALALGFACPQVALLPLVLARYLGLAQPGWAALTGIAGGVAMSLGCIAAYASGADPLALALAVPASLAPGLLCLGLARRTA